MPRQWRLVAPGRKTAQDTGRGRRQSKHRRRRPKSACDPPAQEAAVRIRRHGPRRGTCPAMRSSHACRDEWTGSGGTGARSVQSGAGHHQLHGRTTGTRPHGRTGHPGQALPARRLIGADAGGAEHTGVNNATAYSLVKPPSRKATFCFGLPTAAPSVAVAPARWPRRRLVGLVEERIDSRGGAARGAGGARRGRSPRSPRSSAGAGARHRRSRPARAPRRGADGVAALVVGAGRRLKPIVAR